MRTDVTVLFTEVSASTGQWNMVRHAFHYRGYQCEMSLSPENKSWVGQRGAMMRWFTGADWVPVMVPPMSERVGEYPGTYGPDAETKRAALQAAAESLTDYLCQWIDVAVGEKA